MNKRFIVVGTDTNVGKTVFSAGLAIALGAYYWKPVQTGMSLSTDSSTVQQLGIPSERILPERWLLKTPASPHFAAEQESVTIDPADIVPPATDSSMVIEAAGGLMVPLTRQHLFIDVLAAWDIPAILCARTTLGTINHSLLSLDTMRQRGINVHGIAFIGHPAPDSEEIIASFSKITRHGRLPWLSPLTAATLQRNFEASFPANEWFQ